MSLRVALCVSLALIGCGNSSDPASNGNDVTPSCTGPNGAAITCPVTIAGPYCEQSDAKSCVVPFAEELAVGTDGQPCLRLAYHNHCDGVIYALTNIEFVRKGHTETEWQGFYSTVWPGFDIDVSQCGATGRFRQIATASEGKVDLIDAQCALPK
jgi:hypothetical protein